MKKFTIILSFAFLVLGLTSCTKDKDFEDQKYGLINEDAYKIIDIPTAGTTNFTTAGTYPLAVVPATVPVTYVPATNPVVVSIPVHLSANDPASEELNVTLTVGDDARIAAYNASITTLPKFVRMPAANYTLSNGGVAKIPQGGRDAAVTVTFVPGTLTKGVRYIIPVSLSSVDKTGYTISGNQGYRLVLVTIRP